MESSRTSMSLMDTTSSPTCENVLSHVKAFSIESPVYLDAATPFRGKTTDEALDIDRTILFQNQSANW